MIVVAATITPADLELPPTRSLDITTFHDLVLDSSAPTETDRRIASRV